LKKLKSVKELKKIDMVRKAHIEYQDLQEKDKKKRLDMSKSNEPKKFKKKVMKGSKNKGESNKK